MRRLLVLAALASSCHKDCPLPDELDAAFAKGTACMPTNAPTGDGAKLPLRFDLCLYDCVTLGARNVNYFWQCAGPQCDMVVLALGHLTKVAGKSCDGCQLEDPPASSCVKTSVGFTVDPPSTTDATGKKSWVANRFAVHIPYVTLDQARKLQADPAFKTNPAMALAAAGIDTRAPSRTFTVTFDPKNPAAGAPEALAGADCHAIDLPH